MPTDHFVLAILEMGSRELFWPRTTILLILAFQIARITGMSPWLLGGLLTFEK
jgi:hypothetical protein